MTMNFRLNGASSTPRTLHEIERDTLPLLTANEASKKQDDEFARAFAKIEEWLAAPEGTAPQIVFEFPAGNGKTTAAIRNAATALLDNPDLRILLLVQSLDTAEERAEDARRAGIDRVRVVRGRSQPISKGSEERMCAKADLAALLTMKGQAVGTSLCKGKDDAGQEVSCEFYDVCPYIKQMEAAKNGGLLIASHQYLNIPMETLKSVDVVIIDETFSAAMEAIREVDLSQFATLRTVGQNFHRRKGESADSYKMRELEESADFVAAIERFRAVVQQAEREKRQPTLAAFKAAGFTAEECRHLAVLEYSRFDTSVIHPGMRYEVQAAKIERVQIQAANGYARVWKILADEIETGRDGAPHGLVFAWNLIKDGSTEERNVIRCHWSRESILKDTATIMLDANAKQTVTQRYYPEAETRTMRVKWQNVRTTVVSDRTGSKKMFAQPKRKAELANLVRTMAWRLWSYTAGQGNPANMIGLISHKATIEALADQQLPCMTGYFGNLRGTNRFQDCRLIIIAGRSEPSVRDIEARARAVHYKAAVPLVFIEPNEKGELFYPKRRQTVTASNGQQIEVEVSYHPDPRINDLLEMSREAELSQAAARGRFIHNEQFTELLVLSNVPTTDIPVDRFAEWSQIAPDRFDVMALDGMVFEKSEDVADANPALFASAAAVRQAWSRRADRLDFFGGASAGDCDISVYKGDHTVLSQSGLIVRATFERIGKDGKLRVGGVQVRRLRADETAEEVAQRVRDRLKDVQDVDVSMVEPPAPETAPSAAAGAEKPRRHKASGIRYITRAALLLSYVTGERPFFMEPRDEYRKKISMTNPANSNATRSTFAA